MYITSRQWAGAHIKVGGPVGRGTSHLLWGVSVSEPLNANLEPVTKPPQICSGVSAGKALGLFPDGPLFIKGADGQCLSIGKVESMQESLIGGVSARTLEQRVHFYPSNPDLSLVSRLFHPVPSFVGVT